MMKAYLKSLKIIHIALCFGVAFFIGVAYFLHYMGSLEALNSGLPAIFDFLVPTFAFLSPLAGVLYFNKKVNEIKLSEDALEKRKLDYRAALIVKWAFIEGPAFFAIVTYLLSPNYLHLIMAGIVLVFLIIQHPTDYRLCNDLDVDPKECV